MDLQRIKYFLVLSEQLHYWKTAEKVNITQSALSRQIQSLENELGLQLFDRNKRNVKLTPAGQFLKEKWEVELSELDYIHQFAKQIHLGERGAITIAHPDSISASIMPDILVKISQVFPQLQIKLVQVLYENQLDFLKNYKIDLAITRDINSEAGINSRKLHSDHLALVVPEEHALKSFGDLSAESLRNEKFILPTRDEGSSYSEIIHSLFRSYGFVPDAFLHSEFGSTIIALVRRGLGIAILPDSYLFHQSPGLRFIPLPFKTDIFINWRADDHNPVLANILNLLIEHYGGHEER
ncbi:LysR family transcriptional regulator [Pedobacter sp. Leaf216]|uniref:LysR substrate-binding domain-containing protein n=1 Tax=Pedobacter sp. Leaf216 TaxID=1735684 RepID=UPI0006F9CFE9|nr:LysR substrate-binding domain-containing protein [Pedobacter sp. Leaf216]KQM72642.1 LysR family transcriptional regulator [Pedobacter sp. Leaf216]